MRSVRLVMFIVAVLSTVSFPADAGVLITIDKSAQRMSVAVDGAVRWTWPVSTGRRGYATPSGSYAAFRMEKEHYSQEWDDAPAPCTPVFVSHTLANAQSAGWIWCPKAHALPCYDIWRRTLCILPLWLRSWWQ